MSHYNNATKIFAIGEDGVLSARADNEDEKLREDLTHNYIELVVGTMVGEVFTPSIVGVGTLTPYTKIDVNGAYHDISGSAFDAAECGGVAAAIGATNLIEFNSNCFELPIIVTAGGSGFTHYSVTVLQNKN